MNMRTHFWVIFEENTFLSEIDKIDYDLYGLISEEVRIVGTVKRYRFFVPLQFG